MTQLVLLKYISHQIVSFWIEEKCYNFCWNPGWFRAQDRGGPSEHLKSSQLCLYNAHSLLIWKYEMWTNKLKMHPTGGANIKKIVKQNSRLTIQFIISGKFGLNVMCLNELKSLNYHIVVQSKWTKRHQYEMMPQL